MAISRLALESGSTWQLEQLGGQCWWTGQASFGGFTGLLEQAPTRLTSWNKSLASKEAARFSAFGRNPTFDIGCLAGDRLSSEYCLQYCTLWCGSRQARNEKRRGLLGCHHRFYKSARVKAQLVNTTKKAQLDYLDMEMGPGAWSLPHDRGPGRPAAYERGVTADIVSTLCREGSLAEAVEALGLLVQTERCVSKALFYTVLKNSVVEKDLVMGRRVHAYAVKGRYESDTFLGNHILRMYASHGRLKDAMDVFTMVAEPDAFMWSSIISAHVKQGQEKQAIQLYHRMCRAAVKPDGYVFVAALQACARGSDLKTGQQVHADILAAGVESDLFVSSCLVDMYAKCGSLAEAQTVFDGLGQKNVVTWNAMMAGYSQQGKGHEALRLYRSMQEEGISVPNSVTFVCLLQACAVVGTSLLGMGKQLHSQIREQGHDADVVVANSLVNMYAKCGSLEDAQEVFDGLGQKDVVSWNAMIAGYSQQGMGQEALRLYTAMQEEGVTVPSSVTFVCLLQACASLGTPVALEEGKQLHRHIREQGYEADAFVANSLVNMYAKCGSLHDAQIVFDGLGQRDVVTWTVLIAGYCQEGMGQEALSLYSTMQEEGMVVPDCVTFVCLLQACASVGPSVLEKGTHLHAEIRKQGHHADVIVANSLINMYAKCGSLEDARKVFDELSQKGVVMWNAIIAGYCQQGRSQEAFQLFRAMEDEGTAVPDSVTFVCLLQACASVGTQAIEMGKQLHTQIREGGHQHDLFVANSLINMYAKCGSLHDAEGVFEGLGQKDVVTWNAMIAGYSQLGMGQEALHLYNFMEEEGTTVPDSVTFVCLLQACASVGTLALEKGKQLHTQIRERGHQADSFVGNSLVHMYAKCGSLVDAQSVFDSLGQKDVATWTGLIAGYSQQGMGQEALCLYSAMQAEGSVVTNSVTFVGLLQGCANVAGLHLGRQLHAQIEEQGLQADVFVAGSLITMYGKCGCMADAQQVFDSLPQRDVVVWSALIAGYTCQGDSEVVFDLIERMRKDGIQPVAITFVSVLTVCSYAGLVDRGGAYFEAMSRHYGITPTVEHYTCMVDLLGRAGRLDEALALIRTMPVPADVAVWHTLLGACRNCSNVEMGRHAFDQVLKLENKNAAAYVVMSSIYTSSQMREQAEEMQARRARIGAWKQAGQSWWIDMDGLVHSFVVGEQKRPKIQGVKSTTSPYRWAWGLEFHFSNAWHAASCKVPCHMHNVELRRPNGCELGQLLCKILLPDKIL